MTFTATVKTGGVTATDATGTFAFKVDGTLMATVPIDGGTASYSTSGLTSGAHAIVTLWLMPVMHSAAPASLKFAAI